MLCDSDGTPYLFPNAENVKSRLLNFGCKSLFYPFSSPPSPIRNNSSEKDELDEEHLI